MPTDCDPCPGKVKASTNDLDNPTSKKARNEARPAASMKEDSSPLGETKRRAKNKQKS
jgi:hypothetical protein